MDNWQGHLTTSSSYYCQVPGWYLCQGTTPFAYTGTTQYCFAAGFKATTGGVSVPAVRGQLLLMGSGKNPVPQACDLIEQTVTGPPGGTGDGIYMTGLQTSGGTLNSSATGSKVPYMSVRWVCAISGTATLGVPANAAWPVPPSYVTALELNTGIRDTIRFLTYPPVCKAYYTAGSATIPNQVFPAGTVVPLNTILVDNYNGFVTGGSGGFSAPVAGVYCLYAQVNYASSSATSTAYSAGLSVNGAAIQWGDSTFKFAADSTGGGAVVRKRIRLAYNDFVQFYAQQSSGGALALNTSVGNQTRFIAVWESA